MKLFYSLEGLLYCRSAMGVEELTISVPEEYSSKMIDMVIRRKGELTSMETQGDRVNIAFNIPSRGIIGLRTNVLTASAGEAIMAHRFKDYEPYKGDIDRRTNGSMIAMESGTAFAYAIDKLQDRGKFFISPQDEAYAGQVVGEHVHDNDLVINVTKSKKLTNMRASGSDDKARIVTDTTFYILAVYFGSVGIRKTRHAVTCGLLADLAGIISAIFICYLFFG